MSKVLQRFKYIQDLDAIDDEAYIDKPMKVTCVAKGGSTGATEKAIALAEGMIKRRYLAARVSLLLSLC